MLLSSLGRSPDPPNHAQAQGNRRINLSTWKQVDVLGHVRDLHFISPIKGAFSSWGASHAKCFQSHRYQQYAGGRLVFESSQTLSDIPYGDCFTVDKRWDVTVDDSSTEDCPMVHVEVSDVSKPVIEIPT